MTRRVLRGSTLAETLVVMILTGIMLLSVFDGFALFERLLRRIQGGLQETMDRTESLYRLQSLFAGSDSIRGEALHLKLYRQGAVRDEVVIDDTLLILRRPGTETPPDTLPGRVSEPRIVRNPERPERIDSLYLLLDTTPLRLGIAPRPEHVTESEAEQMEKNYENHADQ